MAGCGGGGDDGGATRPETAAPTGGPVEVTVVNGDTLAPVAGATVVGTRSGQVVATATSGDDGRVEVPLGTRRVTATAPGFSDGAAGIGGAGPVQVDVYDPELQSPEYGGGPTRDRYVPGVTAPLPDGDPAWSFESRTLIEFPPAVDDGLLVFGVNSGRVYGLDARTGAVRWARRQKGEIASSPAIAGDQVFISSMDGMLSAYGRGGTPRWQFSTGGSPVESSPLVVDGRVYVGAWNGTLYAVDAKTGTVDWTFAAAADIKGSAALAGNLVVFADYAGNVYAVDPATGAQRWRYSGGQRFYGGPAVSGSTLVIGDVGGAVIALDTASGARALAPRHGGLRVLHPGDRQGHGVRRLVRRQLRGAGPRRRRAQVDVRRRRAHLRLGDGRRGRRLHGDPRPAGNAAEDVRPRHGDGEGAIHRRRRPVLARGRRRRDPLPGGDAHHRCLSRPDAVRPPSGPARSRWWWCSAPRCWDTG